LKPEEAAVASVYRPGGTDANLYEPSESDVVVCALTRFGPLNVIVTLGTTAPLGSVTVPSTTPVVVVCAKDVDGTKTNAIITANVAMNINLAFIIKLLYS
jgi:hypothetical protein